MPAYAANSPALCPLGDEDIDTTRIRSVRESDTDAVARILRSTGWFDYISAETPEQTESRISRQIRACLADACHSSYVAETIGRDVSVDMDTYMKGYVIGYAQGRLDRAG
jgi:hypothetical protein